jgi:hypothetical protein
VPGGRPPTANVRRKAGAAQGRWGGEAIGRGKDDPKSAEAETGEVADETPHLAAQHQ